MERITAKSGRGPLNIGAYLPSSSGGILPGLALAVLIAASAFALRQVPGVGVLSPLILSILIGMAFHNLIGTPASAKPGVAFSLRRVLRAGIVLLGLQLTVQQVAAVGLGGVTLIVATLLATFVFTTWLGRVMGVDRGLTQLIAAGSSICGASAVIATNTVTRARDEDVAYAVACVTVFGSLSMVLMPLVAGSLSMGPHAFGLWAGASIHEVAQVVAAAYARGQEAGEFGTIAKLTRVMMLAPVVLTLGALAARRLRRAGGEAHRATPPVPWFVFGFIAMVGLASTGWLPEVTKPATATLTQFLLATALAAMGLETDIRKLAAEGIRPALLGAGAWIFVSLFSLGLVLMTI
ncbi:YeiH family protein [Antarcticimicrobium sediminis]|uniref:YeiH family putative sulfate export transporter n=1 Tax=Antarcticimicrobium sediminis TaxID=2546227 RepID=A0A4R5ETP1_9RHOB|nr:YeiH family protein [Antarcticimicrobium sediminis]TDE38047.1 YeiH family putative sulfate export transporter [Antarcticimicrobium sediminis]